VRAPEGAAVEHLLERDVGHRGDQLEHWRHRGAHLVEQGGVLLGRAEAETVMA
jgi:hypothetical protein